LADDLLKRIANHRLLNDRLFYFEALPDLELQYCYQHATALLLPSAGEGFGLPIVEAARFGEAGQRHLLVRAQESALDRQAVALGAGEREEQRRAEAADARLREQIDGFPALGVRFVRQADHQEARGVQAEHLGRFDRVEHVVVRHEALQDFLAHARAARLDAEFEDVTPQYDL